MANTMNGLAQGIQIGNSLVDAYYRGQENKERAEVKNVMAEGLAGAKQSQADAIAANSQVGSKANADNTMTMPTFDDTNGNSYANAEDQAKAAKKNAPSIDDFYMRDVVPKIKETYLAQGNAEGADAWDKWSQEKTAQTGMKHWTQALRAAQMGDFKSYADNMVKAYNTPGYYDDGLHADGYDLVKDKDGNTTGLTLKMKNKDTGESFAQTIHGQDDMVQAGIGLLDPANAFKTTMAQVTARQAASAKANLEVAKTENGMIRDNNKAAVTAKANSALEDQKAGNKEGQIRLTKQLDSENSNSAVTQKVKLLESAGYDKEFIKAALPQILGVGQYKKPADPQEVRRMLHQARLNDFNYSRKSPQEQAKQIEQDLQLISGGGGGQSNPLTAGLPGAQASATPAKGSPMIYDTKTGQMLPYQ